jgi:hypothetical protein
MDTQKYERTKHTHVCPDGKARTVYKRGGKTYVQRRRNGKVTYVVVRMSAKKRVGGAPDDSVCCAMNMARTVRETKHWAECPEGMRIKASPC